MPGIIAQVTKLLSDMNVNIGTMTVTRESKGEKAIMIIEIDERHPDICQKLRQLSHIDSVTYFD